MKRKTLLTGATVGAGLLLAIAAVSAVLPLNQPAATPSSQPPTTTTATTTPGVSLRPVDGGPDYYARFAHGLPADPSYFPLGVWSESVVDPGNVAQDKQVGLNTYVALTANSDIQLALDSGMYAIPAIGAPAANGHPSANGFLLTDEVDMWAGPGSGAWSGNYPGEGPICAPAASQCGYTVQSERHKAAPPGTMLYANYGKGVAFWESDAEAQGFFNGVQDLVSADTYWFTDPGICSRTEGGAVVKYAKDLTPAECRLAANYGWTVDRLRKLSSSGNPTPVWAFVEAGHPFDNAPAALTITGPQLRAAVWSSLIHGARGIIYFNHSFGGQCATQHVLRDCAGEVQQTVTSLNKQITGLAPVLNAPFLDGATVPTGPVDTTTKVLDHTAYVFAGANTSAGGTATIHLACGGSSAVVIDENRSIPVVDGTFTDTFIDGNAVHLYRIQGSSACGF
ncbi:hypothetical protein [Arthrobacter sp. efr-133-TYG-104]|uniref:hypothetical protein n=1 Tax=Arthrobacter sp. efr-133-TYG-104 TaxID=3040324 RepID=UPI00254B1644|nr:hypothetical protein [Arthrobacter sp. efr-133-TYG-104]